ncbi:MAG: adenosylcobinamide-phosphate synthase CbiB [Verrucomicrobiota bacterium]
MSIWAMIVEGLTTTPWQLGAALILDVALGDPRRLPHPAKWTGAMAARMETVLVKWLGRTVGAGFMFWAVICLGQGALVIVMAFWLPSPIWWVIETWLIYQCFAALDMHRHVRAILRPLAQGDLPEARSKLGWIVGRDTTLLSETEVCRATVESVGESACDALMAPLFWSAVGGPFGAVVYRATNTLDSIVGHRGERYEKFGKTSARMDDALNWIPARLVALLSAPGKLMTFHRESQAHRSPNAGWGEAAVAWATGVRLGGINFYEGEALEGPTFNENGREPDQAAVASSLRWWWQLVFAGIHTAIVIFYILCAKQKKNDLVSKAEGFRYIPVKGRVKAPPPLG